jgi:serine/threonine protein kinase
MANGSATKRDFFISFNTADDRWAEWIAWVLEEAGYSVWFQDWDFRGNFVEHMNRAHAQAERTLAVLSEHYFCSDFTLPEWSLRFAQDPAAREDRLIPVKVGPLTDAGILTPIVYADLTECNEQEALRALLGRVKKAFDPDYRDKPKNRPGFPGGLPRQVSREPIFPPMLHRNERNDSAPAPRATAVSPKVHTVMAAVGFEAEREREGLREAAKKVLPAGVVLSDEIFLGESSQVLRGEYHGRKVAIKIVYPSTQVEKISTSLLQALSNAQDQASKHPYLIEILFFNWDVEPHYIVMDFIEWPTVDQWLRNQRQHHVEPRFVAQILSKLADAQAVAHQRGLPLGPLSPQEVYINVSRNGELQAIRISPFRMGALLPSLLGFSDGLPFRWDFLSRLPPEVYEGRLPSRSEYDSCGQYFLGLLGIEVLRGNNPVEVRCLADLERLPSFYRNPRGFFAGLSETVPSWTECSPALAFVISRLLEREPSKRYPSSGGAASELEQVAQGLLPQSVKDEIMLDFDTVVCSSFAERFYSRLFTHEGGEHLRALFPDNIQPQHAKFTTMLGDILAYNPRIGRSLLEDTFRKHTDFNIRESDVDVFRKAFVEEVGSTFLHLGRKRVGRKREAWNVVLQHAFVGLKIHLKQRREKGGQKLEQEKGVKASVRKGQSS